jgi:hypothetical protein
MKSSLRLFKLVFMLVLSGIGTGALADDASASHYRGGAMVPRVNASGQLTVTTTTYWRKDLTSAAMPALSGVPLPQSSKSTDTSDSRFNAVVQTHTRQLPSPGTYTITWGGSARVGGINNAAEAGWQLTSKLYWDGSAANIPIYFDLGAVQPEVVAGESYAGSLGAVAGSGATLTYDQALALSINSQPPGFAINSSTGALSIPALSVATWQENIAGNAGADYAFSGNVFASDGSQVQFDWLFDLVQSGAGVARAPVITDGSVSAASGDTVSYQFDGTDANGDALAWTFLDLLGNEVVGASFDGSTRTVTWDTTGSAQGTYVVLVRASDGSKSDTGQLTITLGPPAQAPVVNDGTLSATAGNTVSYTFTGSDGNGDPLTWSFVVLVGNEVLPGAFDPATQTFTWNTTGSPAGTYVARAQASDGARTDVGELTITLAAAPVPAVPAAPAAGDSASLAVEVPETFTGPVSRLVAPPQTKTGYARTLDIVLAIKAPGGADFVWISNDPGFASARRVPVSASGRYDWQLPGDGERKVYVRFVDEGSVSDTLTEKVLVDVTQPKLLWAKYVGAGRTPGAELSVPQQRAAMIAGTKQRSWITVRSTDDLSGLAWMQYGPAKTKPFAWRNFLPRASVRVVRGSAFVWLRVADRAGNISSWMKVPLGKQVVKTKKPAKQKAPAGG